MYKQGCPPWNEIGGGYFCTTLKLMISSLDIFCMHDIGSLDISIPKIFVKIYRRRNDLRTTSQKSLRITWGQQSSQKTNLYERVFPEWSPVATVEQCPASSSLISSDSYRPYSAGQVIEKNEQLFLVCLAFSCAPQSLLEAGPQQNSIKVGLVAKILFPNLFIRTQFVCSESSIPSRNLLVETVSGGSSPKSLLPWYVFFTRGFFSCFGGGPMEPTKCIESDQHHMSIGQN